MRRGTKYAASTTYAHHNGRLTFGWQDLIESMETVESGIAINVEYVEHETRAVAVHEAGHAAAAHVYRKGVESSRLSVRMRSSGSLAHHTSFEKEERFSSWQSEEMAALIHTLGAMAAERVFYRENSVGVGGTSPTRPSRLRGWWAEPGWVPSRSTSRS